VEIDAIEWVDPDDVLRRPTTPGLAAILISAARLAEARR
jgi:hypothetical protein